MDYEELLEYLDIEHASQFEYFEAMADLIESEEYIENEAVYKLFDGADKTMIASQRLFRGYHGGTAGKSGSSTVAAGTDKDEPHRHGVESGGGRGSQEIHG